MQFHSSYKCAEISELNFFRGLTQREREREREIERQTERERLQRERERMNDQWLLIKHFASFPVSVT